MVAGSVFLRWLRRFILIGATVLFALGAMAAALIGLFLLPGEKPVHFEQDVVRTINCYGSTPYNTVSVPIRVEFQEHGRTAILHFGEEAFRLPFQHSQLYEDVYGDGTIKLRIDPEVYLTGLSASQIGPCDLE